MAEAVREKRSSKQTKKKKSKAKDLTLKNPDISTRPTVETSALEDIPTIVCDCKPSSKGEADTGLCNNEQSKEENAAFDGKVDTQVLEDPDKGQVLQINKTEESVNEKCTALIEQEELLPSTSPKSLEEVSSLVLCSENKPAETKLTDKELPKGDITKENAAKTLPCEKALENVDQGESFYSAVSSLSERDISFNETPCSKSEEQSPTAKTSNLSAEEDIRIRQDGIYPHLSVMYKNLRSEITEENTKSKNTKNQPVKTAVTHQVQNLIIDAVTVGQMQENQPIADDEASKPTTEFVTPSAPLKTKVSQPATKREPRVKMVETHQDKEKTFQPLTLEQLQSLYYNPELINNVQYIDQFIQLEKKKDGHEFLEILNGYLRARKSLLQAEGEVNALQSNYTEQQEQVWVTVKHSVNAKGPCGDGYQCKTTHLYDVCEFSDQAFANTKRVLEAIRHLLQNQLALHSYSAQLARLQVESYIHNLFMTCPVMRDLPRNAPVHVCDSHSPNEEHQIKRLKDCITVLFTFHRKPVTDEQFVRHIKEWTIRLVSALVRVASYRDHLFILNHILRCPAGVGLWSAGLIQIPPMLHDASQAVCLGSPVLDHLMTCLATVLMPIKAREEFICLMKEAITPDPQQGNNWILVDSDGEEDEDPKNTWMYLLENDFVDILKQIPIAEIFKHVLLIASRLDGGLDYDIRRTTDAVMIKLFAFCTWLLNVLGWGLQTYSMARYRQLNKRLGRMIRQTVQYVSDHWENFQNHNRNVLPGELLQRLQMEYSQFFLRATSCIFTAQRLGCWQFMTDMPYSTISKEMAWQLLWLFHQGRGHNVNLDSLPPESVCVKFITEPDSRQQLCDIIQQLPMSESIYLLTALANMAQSRRADEAGLIQAICLCLFEVCYVCGHTREQCSKVGRELLAATATVHPYILSLLIQGTRDNMDNIGPMALYLFKELPFDHWLPRESDLEILRSWLLSSDLSDPKHQVARLVLNRINWSISHETKSLYVPYDVHRRVAIILTEAYGKFVINKNLGFWFLEGMKQVASALKQQQTSEQQFNNWSWEVAIKLHLHHSSLPRADQGLAEAGGGPPNLVNDNSLLPVSKGIKEKNPMACYVAIMATKFGHDNASFLSEGLGLLANLADSSHYRPTLHVLSCVSALFTVAPQALTENDKFMKVVQCLTSADDSILKATKLWSHDFPGPLTKLFSCMIQDCVQRTSNENDGTVVLNVIKLWIKLLVKVHRWYQDRNTCYLVDNLVRTAFTLKGGIDAIQPAFQGTFIEHHKESQQQGAVSMFVNWVSSGASCAMIPSLVEKMTSPENFSWLAYIILDMEYKFEEQSKLWITLKEELHADPKLNPEQALKKSVQKLKLEYAPGLHSLNIYRLGRQALDTPISHQVLPLLWQRFFLLFFGRMVSQLSMQQKASVGEKMYDISKHMGELKKMKKRLKETADYQVNLSSELQKAEAENTETDDVNLDDTEMAGRLENVKYVPKKEFHQELARFFQTFQVWTEEPMLHDAKLYLPALPAQYQSDRLLKLFQNQTDPWLEMIDTDRIVYELAQMSSEWQTSLLGEEGKSTQSDQPHKTISATERILRRLQRHDQPKELPVLQPLQTIVPDISITVMQEKTAIMHMFKSDLNVLMEYAKSFHGRTSHHIACDDDYIKLLPKLLYNRPRQVQVTIECKSAINPLHKCSNPAVVNVNIKEKTTDEIVKHQVDENRAEFKQLMIEGINPPPQHVCVSAVHVENAITMLVKLFRSCTDDQRLSHYKDTACTLFFYLAESFNHDISFYPPTKQFFTACLDLLGSEFIQQDPSQPEVVLQFVLDHKDLAGHLSPHFVPLNSPHGYLTIYERLVQVLQQKNTDLVFTLLTKFDIEEWLSTIRPSQVEVKRLSDIMGSALYSCGANPDSSHSLVFEIYCSHLKTLLHHQFPAHLKVVLSVLLQGMAEQKIHMKCWKTFYAECFGVEPQITGKIETLEEGQETMLSTVLPNDQLKDLLQWLGTYFQQLRMSSAKMSTFGLYPNLHEYIPCLSFLLRDLIISLIIKMAPHLHEMNPTQALDVVWQTTVEAFCPWIQTIQTQVSVLFPWIQADMEEAKKMITAFRCVVDQMQKSFHYVTRPYQRDALTLLWHFFSQVLCCKTTPSHVTLVYTDVLRHLPWNQLKPDFHVLESMIQLKDTNNTESFELLAHIVCELDWTDILQFYSHTYPGDGHSRALATVLILLIQCFGDQKHIEIPALAQKMQTAETYDWSLLTSESFRHAANWLLQTCDPTCVLVERSSSAALGMRLLKTASGFSVQSSTQWSSELSAKRLCYVHSVVQLLCQCTFSPNVNLNTVAMAILNLMTEVETVCSSVVDQRLQQEETLDLVKEILGLLNNCNPENQSLDTVMSTIVEWLQSSPHSTLLLPCVKAASRCLAAHKQIVRIIEECICVYFKGGLDQTAGGGWDHVLGVIQIPDLDTDEFLNTALQEEAYLLLYGYIVLQQPLCQSLKQKQGLIQSLLNWVNAAKPSQDNESKLLILFFKLLELILIQMDFGGDIKTIIPMLKSLVSSLHQFGEDRVSTGILGAIGFGKRSVLSLKFRVLARALSAMVSMQIKGDTALRIQPGEPLSSTSQARSEFGALQSLKTSKQYQQFRSEIQIACEFIQNDRCCFRDSLDLIHNLSVAFYAEKEYLSVVHHYKAQ